MFLNYKIKKLYLIPVFLIFSLFAAGQPNTTCQTAMPFCIDSAYIPGTSYTYPLGTSGTVQAGPYYGCLASGANPVWYYTQALSAGGLSIYMHNNYPLGQPNICWGPFSSLTGACAQLTSANIQSCDGGGSYVQSMYIQNSVVGQYYLFCITNPLGNTGGVYFTSSGSGSSLCDIIVNNGPLCEGDSLIFHNLNPHTGNIYSWTGPNGFTSTQMNPVIPNVTVANAGVYSMNIISGSQTNTVYDTVYINPAPIPAISGNNPCPGATLNLTSSGGTSYLWSGPSGFTSTFQNPTISNATTSNAGIYYVTVTNTFGCTAITSTSVTIALPTPTATNTSPLCSGDTLKLFSSGGNTYLWNGPNGFVSTLQNPVISSVAITDTGTYTVLVTDINTCTATTSTNVITIYDLPVPVANNNSPLCSGDTLNLTSSGGTSYSWSCSNGFASTLQNPVISGTTTANSGVYTVTVTDANTCSATASTTVTINPVLSLAAANNSPLCEGNTLNLTAGGGTTYTWAGPGGFTDTLQNPSISNATTSNSGVYSVTATDNLGCTGTISTNVVINPNPAINISSNSPLCTGDNLLLTSSSGSFYLWSGPNGFLSTTQNPAISNVTALNTGTYNITITNSYSCTSTASTQVNISSIINMTVPSYFHLCHGTVSVITASATGGTPPLNYYWNGILSTPSIVNNAQSNTVLSVYAVDSNNCYSDTGYVTINVYPMVNIDITTTNDSICPGDNAIISANITQGNGGPYLIYMQDGTVIVPPVTVNPLVTTDYIIFAKDGCGTTDSDTVRVKVSYIPSTNFTSDITNACEPVKIQFNQNSINSHCTYMWNFGDAGSNNVSHSTNPYHWYKTDGTFSVSLTITTQNGCTYTNTNNNMITIYPKPEANFIANPSSASIINPQIYFDNLSILNDLNLWTFGNGDTSNIINPTVLFDSTTTYIVRLIIESLHGCKDTVSDNVKIIDECTFYVPSAFTPNGDGLNDTFFVKGIGIDTNNFHMYIFDRWGFIVYETDKYDVKYPAKYGWDGSVKYGRKGEIGTYTWYIIYKDIHNNRHEKAGPVFLID